MSNPILVAFTRKANWTNLEELNEWIGALEDPDADTTVNQIIDQELVAFDDQMVQSEEDRLEAEAILFLTQFKELLFDA